MILFFAQNWMFRIISKLDSINTNINLIVECQIRWYSSYIVQDVDNYLMKL